jgi:hypothetical protein
MRKCYFDSCENEATKTVCRFPTEEEQEFKKEERGVSFTAIVENYVCNDDLEEALKEYPHIANKRPGD